MPPVFLRNYSYKYNAIYKYQDYVFHEVEIIFSQSLIHYQHNFSNFAWDAVWWSRKIPWCSVGALQASHCSQNVFLGVHSAGAHRDGIRRWRFIYRSGRTLRIRCFNFFNLYIFRSELIAAPLSKNSTSNFLSLSQKTLPVTLLAEVCTLNFFLRGDVWWYSTDCFFVDWSHWWIQQSSPLIILYIKTSPSFSLRC